MSTPTPAINVAQHDLRSIRVDVGAARLLLRYGLSFDGNERLPESVTLAGTEVTAFFLSFTVRDTICATRTGFSIHRRWSVLQAGSTRLALTIDVPETLPGPRRKDGRKTPGREFRYLFPGVHADASVGSGAEYRGERTALPACVVLAAGDLGVCVFAHPATTETLSVGIERASDDSGPLVRLCFQTPARERRPEGRAPGAESHDPGDGTEADVASGGALERELEVQVVIGEPADVYATALALALGRSESRAGPGRWAIGEQIRSLLATHEVSREGVCGLRVVEGSDVLSASAGAEAAALLCRLYPHDQEMVERALRLGDFVLRGQHPAGLFFERYSLKERSWTGLRGIVPGGTRPPLVSVEESSRIAASLFDLAALLADLGVRGERYLLAARRMVDAFFDSRGRFSPPSAVMTPDRSTGAEESMGALRFLHPLLRVVDLDTRERYRKAAMQLCAEWLGTRREPLDLPASRAGREPDSKAALLLLEAALEALDRRIKVASAPRLPGALLPWIYLGDDAGRGPLPGAGAVVDSLVRGRLKPRPAQISYLCRRYAAMGGPLREALNAVARASSRAAGALPLGCSWVSRSHWEGLDDAGAVRLRARRRTRDDPYPGFTVGPVDSRDFVTELGACIALDKQKLW